jgi:hypothetical protein
MSKGWLHLGVLFAHPSFLAFFSRPRPQCHPSCTILEPGRQASFNDCRRRCWPCLQYSHALFRAVSHMITIGYGLAIPVNVGEVWMVMASMLTGAMMYAVLLGMINSMMQSMDRSGSMYVERMQMWKVRGPALTCLGLNACLAPLGDGPKLGGCPGKY